MSSSGPPAEPRGSVAVCSIAPETRLPRGPRKPRSAAATKPRLARRPRPPGLARATTAVPIPTSASAGAQASGSISPVSTSKSARPRSRSTPTSSAVALRSSAKLTVTPSERTWWAAVSTRSRAITVPDPNRQPRPIPTTAAPCLPASSAISDWISLITLKTKAS